MYAILQIPQPCSVDWSGMTPGAGGRFCSQCCKTVIDFTDWNNEDILHYLQSHNGTCGRFRKDQLNTPIPAPEVFVQQLNRSFLPLARKAAALLLFVFCIMGASCSSPAPVQSLPVAQRSAIPHNGGGAYLTGDTIMPPVPPYPDEQRLLGEPAIVPDTGMVAADPGYHLGGAPVVVPAPAPLAPDSSSGGVQH